MIVHGVDMVKSSVTVLGNVIIHIDILVQSDSAIKLIFKVVFTFWPQRIMDSEAY